MLKKFGYDTARNNDDSRYLAKENGLAGANNLESAQCDEIVDFISDMQNAIVRILLSSGRIYPLFFAVHLSLHQRPCRPGRRLEGGLREDRARGIAQVGF